MGQARPGGGIGLLISPTGSSLPDPLQAATKQFTAKTPEPCWLTGTKAPNKRRSWLPLPLRCNMRAQTTIPSSLHKSQIRRHLWALARNRRSPRSTKTHQVEPDGALGKSRHLTRGDLWGESLGGVSRGYSSEETL